MRISATIAVLLILSVFSAVPARAADRYYTYMGITGGGGINRISYSGWVDDSRRNLDITGSYYSTGLSVCTVINQVIGEFTAQYQSNSNSGEVETSVSTLYLSIAGKYFYSLSRVFHLTAGAGLYGDMPPATLDYEGGGGVLALAGTMIRFSADVMFMAEATARYGTFGLGEGSSKISYGAAVSLVYNVGRI
jgi:hypothetical protein